MTNSRGFRHRPGKPTVYMTNFLGYGFFGDVMKHSEGCGNYDIIHYESSFGTLFILFYNISPQLYATPHARRMMYSTCIDLRISHCYWVLSM